MLVILNNVQTIQFGILLKAQVLTQINGSRNLILTEKMHVADFKIEILIEILALIWLNFIWKQFFKTIKWI